MNVHETRHPNWIKVEPGDGAIRDGDLYRVEYKTSADKHMADEHVADDDWDAHDFFPGRSYFIWPRPEKKPYEAIPEGSENAKVMAVSVGGGEPVVGTYYRNDGTVMSIDASLGLIGRYVCHIARITSAVPVTVVPTEALDVLRNWTEVEVESVPVGAIRDYLDAVDLTNGDNA